MPGAGFFLAQNYAYVVTYCRLQLVHLHYIYICTKEGKLDLILMIKDVDILEP